MPGLGRIGLVSLAALLRLFARLPIGLADALLWLAEACERGAQKLAPSHPSASEEPRS